MPGTGGVFLRMSASVRDWCHTVKSCIGIIMIGALAALAMLLIRLVGENRLQHGLNRLIHLRRKSNKDNLSPDHMVPENRS